MSPTNIMSLITRNNLYRKMQEIYTISFTLKTFTNWCDN